MPKKKKKKQKHNVRRTVLELPITQKEMFCPGCVRWHLPNKHSPNVRFNSLNIWQVKK